MWISGWLYCRTFPSNVLKHDNVVLHKRTFCTHVFNNLYILMMMHWIIRWQNTMLYVKYLPNVTVIVHLLYSPCTLNSWRNGNYIWNFKLFMSKISTYWARSIQLHNLYINSPYLVLCELILPGQRVVDFHYDHSLFTLPANDELEVPVDVMCPNETICTRCYKALIGVSFDSRGRWQCLYNFLNH